MKVILYMLKALNEQEETMDLKEYRILKARKDIEEEAKWQLEKKLRKERENENPQKTFNQL